MMKSKRLNSLKQKPDAVSIVIGRLLGVYVLGLLLPTIWALLTAFMDVKSYKQAYVFHNFEAGKIPFTFTTDNFVIANFSFANFVFLRFYLARCHRCGKQN